MKENDCIYWTNGSRDGQMSRQLGESLLITTPCHCLVFAAIVSAGIICGFISHFLIKLNVIRN